MSLLDELGALAKQGALSMKSSALRHLPLIRYAIADLGIDAAIDERLPPDPRMKATDADCVSLMIMNVLHGRVALYKMADWVGATDPEVLLGEGLTASSFTDTRLAETLDRLFAAGTDDVLFSVVSEFFESDARPRSHVVHQDTTTVVLHGAYELEDEPGAPTPARGHSKDHRPDLLQLVYGLSVHGAVGIPLCSSVLDGNTDDHKANRLHIDELAGLLPPQDEVTLVGDAKLCDAVTLGRVLDADFHFVTLVPRSFTVRETLVEQVYGTGEELPIIGQAHQRLKSDPVRHYRGRSFVEPFEVVDPNTGAREARTMRLLVVESPALEARGEGVSQARMDKERKSLESKLGRLGKVAYACEEDAKTALEVLGRPRYHDVVVTIRSEEVAVKRPRRGRPRKGDPTPMTTVWRIELVSLEVDDELVERARFHGKHFVLVTDHLDTDAWPDERILATYRSQQAIEGHAGFRWLKGPAAVAPVFLNKPSRIAALGLVFMLALMVRNYIEWAVRHALEEAGETLPNLNKQQTARPSAENIFHYFRLVSIVTLEADGRRLHRQLQGLLPEAEEVLRLLGCPVAVFTRPWQKIGGSRTGKAGM